MSWPVPLLQVIASGLFIVQGGERVATPVAVTSPRPRAVARQAGVEDEIKRLVARELHDRVARTLTGMLVDMENFKSEPVGWTDVVEELDKVQSSTRQVLRN